MANKINSTIVEPVTDTAKRLVPEIFQRPFMESVCDYPAFIGAWGTGKTLCGFAKGLMLSFMYPGNYGLIIRREYKALTRSTMTDFTSWTGLKVSKHDPEIEIPNSNGSRICFSHAENLDDFRLALQGMNLGWAVMEQVDEMDNDSVFTELDGRIRRILTPNEQIQKALIKNGVISKITPDFNKLSQKLRDDIEDVIINTLHLPVRQIMLTGNACGHNWVWKNWKKFPLPGRVMFEAQSKDNVRNIPRSTLRRWEQMKYTSPKRYARMVCNSHEDYDKEGSYYAAMMSDLLKAGRVELDSLYNSTIPVYTFWDLGIRASDTTAIWFVQFVGDEIRLIDYLEEYGKGMQYYSKELSRKPYEYAAHYLPPDAVQRLQGEYITSRLDIMQRLRREPVRLVERHRVEERISCVRSVLNRCKFASQCEKGVEALNNYRRKRNEQTSTDEDPHFLGTPADDGWTNGADSFGYMAVIAMYAPPKQDDAYNFYSGDVDAFDDDEDSAGVSDLLSTGS